MNKFSTLLGATLLGACLAPAAASAATVGYVTTNLNLRAGPGTQYPAVAVIPGGSRVNVLGCTRGIGWCDITIRGNRGWVSGNYLDLRHQNRRVRAPAYGAAIGLPIISFQIGSYWDRHYRGRPWYGQRDRFVPRAEGRGPSRVERRFDRPRVERRGPPRSSEVWRGR